MSSSSSSSSSAEGGRAFDLIVWGATGFTGSLVAQYLARKIRRARELSKEGELSGSFRSDISLRWAIGGRNRAKLEQTRRALGEDFDDDANVGIVLADSSNVESLDAMTRSTRVIISTVGPFLLYGRPLVEACVRNSTHYVDITGETPFVKSMIEDFHDTCKEKRIIMVPMSGFDSQPSDLGAFMVADHIKRKYGCGTKNVRNFCEFQGGGSGGTLASIANLVTTSSMKDFRDPFMLNPKDRRPKPLSSDSDQMLPSFDSKNKVWTTPFLMAGANTRVVRRSQALLAEREGQGYGEDFHYQETQKTDGAIEAVMIAVFLFIFAVAITLRPTRWLLFKGLPQPGEGPDENERARSWFKMTIVGDAENGKVVRAIVKGGDPGYGETSKMIAEAALCLAFEREELPDGGILTPASAFGNLLINRLREAGISFDVSETD